MGSWKDQKRGKGSNRKECQLAMLQGHLKSSNKN